MSRTGWLVRMSVVVVLLVGCGPSAPAPPTAARVEAPPPPEPEAPPDPEKRAPVPAAASPNVENPAASPAEPPSPMAETEVAAEAEQPPVATPPATTATLPADPLAVSDEVRRLMLRRVRRQRTRLWELKQKPARLRDAKQWETVTQAADVLAEAADKLAPLAPKEAKVWNDSLARLRRGTVALRKAASDQSVNHFQGAIQTTWRACNDCHAKYAPEAPMNNLEYASLR